MQPLLGNRPHIHVAGNHEIESVRLLGEIVNTNTLTLHLDPSIVLRVHVSMDTMSPPCLIYGTSPIPN